MFDYIEKLRAKKPHQKQMIALGSAFVVTFVLALFWVTTLPYRFSNVQSPAAAADSVSQFQNVQEGFGAMWANATGSYQDIKTSIQASLSHTK